MFVRAARTVTIVLNPTDRRTGRRMASASSEPEFDVIVLGGGPAGTVTATGLRRLGHDVAVITAPRKFDALEGLSERARTGLEFAGCRYALGTVGEPLPRTAYWNGDRRVYNSERVISRRRFDNALIRDAAEAGVLVHAGRAHSMSREGDRYQVRFRQRGRERLLSGRFIVDARGRTADRARTHWSCSPPTISIGRRWRFPPHRSPGTIVAPFARGWMWVAVRPGGDGAVQVFVSGRGCRIPPRPGLCDFYQRLAGSDPIADAFLSGAIPMGAVHVRDAGAGICESVIGHAYVRVGDAALMLDPLSGHGMYQAVSGALAVVPVVNTLLRRPADAELASRFYREKLEDDFHRTAHTGRDFYRQERRWPDSSYWGERSAWPDDEPAHRPAASAPARIEQRPVSEDGYIRLREVIVTADHPRGVWRIADVPVPALLRWVHETGREGSEGSVASAAVRFGVSIDAVRSALAWAGARNLLSEDSDCSRAGGKG